MSKPDAPGASCVPARPVRYLAAGVLNTVVGYFLGVGLYYLLAPEMHVVLIGAIANVLAISFSFVNYKMFVFQTQGGWLREYLRSYLVYGSMAVMGIVVLWILIDGLGLPIWIAQAVAILVTVVVSYLGHARYTFSLAEGAEPGRHE